MNKIFSWSRRRSDHEKILFILSQPRIWKQFLWPRVIENSPEETNFFERRKRVQVRVLNSAFYSLGLKTRVIICGNYFHLEIVQLFIALSNLLIFFILRQLSVFRAVGDFAGNGDFCRTRYSTVCFFCEGFVSLNDLVCLLCYGFVFEINNNVVWGDKYLIDNVKRFSAAALSMKILEMELSQRSQWDRLFQHGMWERRWLSK